MGMAHPSCMDYNVIDVSYVNSFCEVLLVDDSVPFSNFKCLSFRLVMLFDGLKIGKHYFKDEKQEDYS